MIIMQEPSEGKDLALCIQGKAGVVNMECDGCRFLKPGGLMMPTTGDIVMAPYTDEALYGEQLNKTLFWQVRSGSFHSFVYPRIKTLLSGC